MFIKYFGTPCVLKQNSYFNHILCSVRLCLFTVENPTHCDFVKLRNMLIRTHMQDLKDVTRDVHYENYRAQCIQSMTRMVVKERNRK